VQIAGARFWTLRALALEMRRSPPDLLFVPSHVIPPIHPVSVVTVHDVGYLVEPECHNPFHRKQLDWTTRWNCRSARGVIAVSEHTRLDLIERLDVPPDRIQVIYHGVSSHYRPASVEDQTQLRVRLSLPDNFVLAVGTVHPRKNLHRLIQAFELLAADDPELGLVLCGREGWRGEHIIDRATRSPYSERIQYIGFLEEVQLPALYSAARATAFVSLFEGFGLPALESMACGTPVVASNRSSIPEICDNAALLVEPMEAMSIYDGLRSALYDDQLRQLFISRGFERSSSFTWRKCALSTLAFLREIRDNSA